MTNGRVCQLLSRFRANDNAKYVCYWTCYSFYQIIKTLFYAHGVGNLTLCMIEPTAICGLCPLVEVSQADLLLYPRKWTSSSVISTLWLYIFGKVYPRL